VPGEMLEPRPTLDRFGHGDRLARSSSACVRVTSPASRAACAATTTGRPSRRSVPAHDRRAGRRR
jgi:hypothetical protein